MSNLEPEFPAEKSGPTPREEQQDAREARQDAREETRRVNDESRDAANDKRAILSDQHIEKVEKHDDRVDRALNRMRNIGIIFLIGMLASFAAVGLLVDRNSSNIDTLDATVVELERSVADLEETVEKLDGDVNLTLNEARATRKKLEEALAESTDETPSAFQLAVEDALVRIKRIEAALLGSN